MGIEKLSKVEVVSLINEVKYYLNQRVEKIPEIGPYRCQIGICSAQRHIRYQFTIVCRQLRTKYSMHIRFDANNQHLVRLCINGSYHWNPDGTRVSPNHIHIYQMYDNEIGMYAYELDKVPFDASDNLSKAVSKFIDFLHILPQ